MTWQPPARAAWVGNLNALGENLACGGRSLVSLDADEILDAATTATGLSDFGDPWFREPLNVFTRALEDEARLTLTGRLVARSEIQRLLESRLRLEDHISRHPSIERDAVPAPLVITGLGRSGTTFLHELLACDPGTRVPRLWEMMYPVPPPQAATYESDPRIAAAHREISIMDEIVPAFPSMQEVAGHLPNECIFLVAHQFATDKWIGEYDVPGYLGWLGSNDLVPAYRYHRRILQVLQSHHRADHWTLKAPSYLHLLPTLLEVYPDARIVVTHRDPLRVLGSLTNLMASLRWMRSDHVDHAGIVATMAFGFAYQMENLSRMRDEGLLPEDRILDVRYVDLVSDPVATVRRIYAHFEIEFSTAFEAGLGRMLASRPRERRALHEYSFSDTGLDLAEERARHAAYQERYDVPTEV